MKTICFRMWGKSNLEGIPGYQLWVISQVKLRRQITSRKLKPQAILVKLWIIGDF